MAGQQTKATAKGVKSFHLWQQKILCGMILHNSRN
jgi:hypothetical protein